MTGMDELRQQRDLLRQQALRRRRELAARAGEAAAEEITRHGLTFITSLLGIQAPPVIAGYWPVRDEVNVLPLLEALHARGLKLALPVVEERDAPLTFRHWQPGMALEKGAFGIPVPPSRAPALTPAILLVPLVAFDRAGHRLGYGGGYYDRTLARLRARNPFTIAIGCAFAGQELEHIPALSTDARLDAVLTEHGIIRPMEQED